MGGSLLGGAAVANAGSSLIGGALGAGGATQASQQETAADKQAAQQQLAGYSTNAQNLSPYTSLGTARTFRGCTVIRTHTAPIRPTPI